MIYAIYIAAAAVVGVLIGFVVLSVTWLKRTVAKNIRSKTTELISVYATPITPLPFKRW